ncbi:DUF2570 family protein [Serratia fonticola]|uniref:DUF2570 family protein n=1 Tax=Serratia fonticola TaxID=47917 RepID=UPI00164964A4|nr:DUF2570 family protein [Serratia fonticola]MBC3230740.1 DUF2570 family protein [Serratia fonticola]
MSWLSGWKNAALLGLLVTAIILALNGATLSSRLDLARETVSKQGKLLEQQTALIGVMQASDASNRALMAAQLQNEQQLRQQATANERKLLDAIKDDDCAKRDMPGAVVELLQPDTKSGTAAAGPASP